MSTVLYKEYPAPAIDRKEVRRYMGVRGNDAGTEDLIDRTLVLAKDAFTFKVCYTELPISFGREEMDLGFTVTGSKDLRKNLDGCERIVLFAATVGLGVDRLILRHSRKSPSVAVCLQALGAERIESLCDLFCHELAEAYAAEGKRLRPRFSPGYGDLPLETQREIFATLGCGKQIGLTLNGSLLMSPSKSVTAIVGIY